MASDISKVEAFCLLPPEVYALISDLGLILKGSAEDLAFRRAMLEYPFARKHFCDVYKDYLARKERERKSLCLELYKRNRKFSRYVRSSVTNY